MVSLLSLGMKIPFCPCQEVVTDLMSQIQELRTSVSEKTETIDTLRQELEDINVSSFTNKILKLSTRHKCFTQKQGSVFTQVWKYVLVKAQRAWVSAEPAEPLVCWHAVCFSGRQSHFVVFLRSHWPERVPSLHSRELLIHPRSETDWLLSLMVKGMWYSLIA